MFKKSLIVAALILAGATTVQAQSSPAKKELVGKILKLQQPGIETMARGLVEAPAVELLGNAGNVLPNRIAKDKQDAVAKEIQADVQKYLDEAVPIVQARAIKLAPTTIGALLEEKFTEDELKQIVGIIESPVYGKFQRMGEEMQKALVDKVVTDTRSTVEPKVRVLEQTVAKRLGVTAPAGPATSGAPRAPAKPASKYLLTLSESGPTVSTACRNSCSLQCSQRVQLRRSHSCSRSTRISSLPCLPLSSDIGPPKAWFQRRRNGGLQTCENRVCPVGITRFPV